MKTSIYTANRPFTVRIPESLKIGTATTRGGLAILAEELIKKDMNSRTRRKNKTDGDKQRPAKVEKRVRVSVHARVDEALAAKVTAMLTETGIKPRDYVAELLTAHSEGRKPVFPTPAPVQEEPKEEVQIAA